MENLELPRATQGKSTKGTVRMTFVLSPKGELKSGPDIIKSSNSVLNAPAVNAVKKAAPFQGFPQSMGTGDQRFSIEIADERDWYGRAAIAGTAGGPGRDRCDRRCQRRGRQSVHGFLDGRQPGTGRHRRKLE